MASLKGNLFLNGINTVTSLIFPLITFPYAARVLMPEGIGTVNFLNSIIGYIILLTSIGIPLYAVKEVAKYRDDKRQRDRITIEIVLLSALLCCIGYVIVWLLAYYVPQIHQQHSLFYILSLSILFTSIGVNWFYQGTENFKFITIRAIIIRTLSATALYVFVKNPSDILIYAMIVVGSTVGNNFINFIHLRKQIDVKQINIKELKILRHLKPALHVFILNLIVSLYVQLNSIMLGFMSGDDAVGFFTAGTKITHIGLTVLGSISTVLLPRCSHLIKSGEIEEFSRLTKKSLNLTLALSIPMAVGLMVLAVPITMIFCGKQYIDSIPILYLNAPVIISISLTNLMGIQILYPKDKVNIVILSVTVAAILNLTLNFIFIPVYAATGAAIATLIAEFSVLIIQLILGRYYYPFRISSIFNLKYIFASLTMGAIMWCITYPIQVELIKLIIGILSGIMAYSIILYTTKDVLFKELIKMIKTKTAYGKF